MDRDCDEGEGGGGDGLPEIPMEAWEMIERVKEIMREYTDDEIYAMLLECEMDLNETVQRLLSPETFERVKEERERRKEEKIAEEKRLHDIGSSSDFGDRGGSHRHSENTSYKGESSDSAADEYKRQSIGAGDAISSAQSSQVLQPARPGARGRASVADIVRRGRPGTRRHVSKADVVGMGGPGANTSSLPITSTGTSPPLVGAVPEQCGVPNTSSPLITLDEACFPPLGRTPKRSSYHVTPPFVPSPVEAEPHQALHSPNPCDTAEMSQDCQPHEVEASVSSEQLAEYSASAAAGLEKLSMEKGETLSGLPTAHSSLHKLNRLQCELGEATGALVDDSSSGNLDFRNPENHGDEQPRIIPDADRENSASSCARERQGIVGPSLSSEAHAYSDSLPSFQEPTEYSSRESEFFLQFMAEQIQSLRHSSGGSYSSRPTNFVPEDVRQDTFSVSGLPSQALPSIHIAPETTLPRPFALDPDTQHSVSLEHSDNMLAGPSPAQSYASIPSTFQQAHTDEDLSHLLLPELLQDIQQYRNRAPETTLPRPFALDPDTQHSVSLEHSDNMLAGPSPPPSYASIPSAFQQAHTDEDPSHLLLPELLQDIQQYRNRAPETTLPRPFALDPDTQHSVSLEHSDNMRAGPSPPPSYASIPSAFQQAHTNEDPSHLLLPELLQDIQQYRNRAPETTLPRPFALDPDTQHSVSLEHSDNMRAGPSPPPSYASIPSAFQQAHTNEDPSHLLLPELLQDIQQYRNRAPETTLPRPFALDPDTQHSVSLEHSDNMLAGPSPPPSYASIPSAFQQAHTDEDPSHLLLPELLQDIQQYRNRAPVSHLAQPPAGYGNFGGPTNIPPAGHRSFGAPTYIPPADHRSFGSPTYIPPTGHQSFRSLAYIPPAGHRSFGRPTYIPPTGHQSFRSPAYIPPAGHGRFGSATYIPPADYGSLGSPSNIPSRFLNNLPASMNLDEFLRSNEGAHFNPHQGGSSATWVRGPGGSRAIPPAAGSTHYYGLPEQNQQYPRDEGNQRLLQQHRSQGYQTPDGSQSRDPRGRWP
ncbi:formin-like protein 20 isoform X2 [Vitis vinifera]|uniref:formin-like protein 20 isoform X2 n=1 Tax=Vitis vinifera TaxID=29760 RepID=UPI0028831904|nr:formin-like protein 20 isoform X2 [Vitis vinifera]